MVKLLVNNHYCLENGGYVTTVLILIIDKFCMFADQRLFLRDTAFFFGFNFSFFFCFFLLCGLITHHVRWQTAVTCKIPVTHVWLSSRHCLSLFLIALSYTLLLLLLVLLPLLRLLLLLLVVVLSAIELMVVLLRVVGVGRLLLFDGSRCRVNNTAEC